MVENHSQKQTVSEPTNKSSMARWLPWIILGITIAIVAFFYFRGECCIRLGRPCCPCWACQLPGFPEKPELPLTPQR